MSKPQIRVIIVDDDLVDRMACCRALVHDADYEFVLSEAETGQAGLQLAHAQKPDCVLLDYLLPDLNGLEILAELSNDLGEIQVPVIMLTGAGNALVAVEAMKHGAHDYLIKDVNRQYLELLPAVIKRVLRERQTLTEKKQTEENLLQAEAKYRFLVEQIPAIIYTTALDAPNKLLYISPQISQLGYSPEEWLADPEGLLKQIHLEDRTLVRAEIARGYVSGEPLRCECRLLTRAGEVRWFLNEASLVRHASGEPLFMQGVLVDITGLKNLENELKESRQSLRNLADKSEISREDERKRIALEVHDELGQILTALRLDVTVINLRFGEHNAALLEKTQGMAVLLDQADRSVRNIVSNLRPASLEMGIVSAVWGLCDEFAARTGSSCILYTVEERIDLDEIRAVAVFRIVQALLTNAARHAGASSVKVTLARHADDLHVEVRDNGKGFDPAATAENKSFGLFGIRERAIALDGTVDVVSAPNQGTVVTLIVPIKPNASQIERRRS